MRIPRDEILERLTAGERGGQRRERCDDETPACDHWARVVLLERVAYLGQMARFGEGTATDVLREYAGHSAHLFVKLRSGEAEQHSTHASLIFVLDGVAQVVTGGAIEKARAGGSGEITGAVIRGGNVRQVRPGDVLHIRAGMPYQFLLSGERSISYLQLKIREDR